MSGTRDARLLLSRSLGPDLGQCCGGRVDLLLERYTAADASRLEAAMAGPEDRAELLLFGAGHVRARARAGPCAPCHFASAGSTPAQGGFSRPCAGQCDDRGAADPRTALAVQGPARLSR